MLLLNEIYQPIENKNFPLFVDVIKDVITAIFYTQAVILNFHQQHFITYEMTTQFS